MCICTKAAVEMRSAAAAAKNILMPDQQKSSDCVHVLIIVKKSARDKATKKKVNKFDLIISLWKSDKMSRNAKKTQKCKRTYINFNRHRSAQLS